MPLNKPWSVACFTSTSSAAKAHQTLNFSPCSLLEGRPLYLDFVSPELLKSKPELFKSSGSSISSLPSGLHLFQDFLTEDDESTLINHINSHEWHNLSKRQVQHYGYEFDYTTRNVNPSKPLGPLPEFTHSLLTKFSEIIKKIPSLSHLESSNVDQLTINCYEPGQGIPPHVDTHSAFEDGIFSLSLGSDVTMDFLHPDGTHDPSVLPVLLPKRSLIIMTNESRFLWAHGITPRKTDEVEGELHKRKKRISLTFRKIRDSQKCENCQFPAQCDTWRSNKENIKQTSSVEEQHVHKVYDEIARQFGETRQKPWPKIMNFLQGIEIGSLVCDVGCGSGRYLGVNDNLFKIGTDRSLPLLEICKENGHKHILWSDNLILPFRNNCFDVVISIAVIHHFSTLQHRLEAVRELVRILKDGGKVMIYVWAMEQKKNEKRRFLQQDVFVTWKKPKNKEISEGDAGSEQFEVFNRFYHVFKEGELEELVGQIKELQIIDSYYDRENWCVIAQKNQ
eukprot:TRINITY_DN7829_c0_g4_i1.p1 TRINITY_DN7829_c0_g4~~TRINITY_DN7829_c0_g4_i1.p1  ORF type:complete len:507 (+),score=67.14 TRINITY_DN7829_c0_g4_i1:300-1820(+)